MRDVRSRPIKGEQKPVKGAFAAGALPVQPGGEKFLGGGDLVHQAAVGLGVVQAALRLLLDLAEDGAADAHARVFQLAEQFELGAAVGGDARDELRALLAEEHAADAVVDLGEARLAVRIEFFRIDIAEIGGRLLGGEVDLARDVHPFVLQKL